jgi:hypothetical protein
MKRLALLLLLATPAFAQTRVMVGATGGGSFGSLFLGPTVEVEVPMLKHTAYDFLLDHATIYNRFELDLLDTFSPLEEHIALGSGFANQVRATPILWLTHAFGLNGAVESSAYHVTKVGKSAEYVFGGVSLRTVHTGTPMRFQFNYFREFNDGVTKAGVETSHLTGGEFRWEIRMGCKGAECFRTTLATTVGHLLEQGNPRCDGSYPGQHCLPPCPRIGTVSGGAEMGFLVEFPRRRATEDLAW